jgi:hypothetical protein
MSLLTVAAAVGASLLMVSTEAGAATVVASVGASPNNNVVDGTSLTVTGTAPSSVHSVLLIECDSTQMSMVGSPYDPNHCDTTPADEVTVPASNNAFSGSFTFHDPLTTGGAGTVSCDAGCTLLADNPVPGDVSAATMVTGHSCNGEFDGAATGSLAKSTSAGPNDSTVSPGQTITVTLTWNPSDFGGSAPSKSDDCVEIGSTLSTSMSQEHKPGPAGGTDAFSYTVPSGGTNGQQICDRGALSGTGPVSGIEKSAILCYTVMSAATPEVPKALLLPVAGLAVGGGGLLLARRRRAGTRPQN